MGGSGFLGFAGAAALTLGLLFLALAALKRMQNASVNSGSGVPLRLLKRVPLGPKQAVGILQVADRVLVISIAESGARLLTELEPSKVEGGTGTPPGSGARPRAARWLARLFPLAGLALALVLAHPAGAQTTPADPGSAVLGLPGVAFPQVDLTIHQGKEALHLSGAVGIVVFIGFLSLLPVILLLMTSFTRILIVLQFLRPAIGTQNAPPMQLLVALSLLLTGVVMHPVIEEVNRSALQPLMAGTITQAEAYKRGLVPLRQFMSANTADKDLALFADLSHLDESVDTPEQIPTVTLASAFVTSELRTAFQMGFLIFLPFIVVDLIVASVLMSLGMFMLPPMMVSLPFKLLLFVLADGWALVFKNLVLSFGDPS